MLWMIGDLIQAVKDFIKMLRDKRFWRELRENMKDLSRSPYG